MKPGTETSKRKFLRLLERGTFQLNEDDKDSCPHIRLHVDHVNIDCTTVGRSAIERLYELFQQHFPIDKQVEIQ